MAFQSPPTGSISMLAGDLLTYEPGEPCVFLIHIAPYGWQAHLLVRPLAPPADYFPAVEGFVNCVRLCDSTNQRVGNNDQVHVIPANWLNLKLFV